jgi:spore maturation protein CgeB
MRIVLFCHSLLSDWNHGNAHFLRGIATELVTRGHDVLCWEPSDSWSLQNLLREHGSAPVEAFREAYPLLAPRQYDPATCDVSALVDGADLVIVHEWNDPALVARIGEARRSSGRFRLLFHDTHHRAVTAPAEMASYDLRHYDGVLAFGEVIRQLYIERGWCEHAWTWHEAADTRVFRPLQAAKHGDLVWIGNWGDGERSDELQEFIIGPVQDLHLAATVHGVRYPETARQLLAAAGIAWGSWLPNFEAPSVYARFRCTVHVPRRPYRQALPGIPTIRPFEALACGIPLISAPWDDTECLFRPGTDFLVAHNGGEMRILLHDVLHDDSLAAELAANGRRTVLDRHTCAHRVDELMAICVALGVPAVQPGTAASPHSPAPVAP